MNEPTNITEFPKLPDVSNRYLYWMKKDDFERAKGLLEDKGYRMNFTVMTPCQVLKSRGKNLLYAPPKIWSGICKRQGSWYRASDREGQYMMMSDHRLPEFMDRWFDAEMNLSGFQPEKLPDPDKLQSIVDTESYQREKPDGWEGIGLSDSVLFKVLFRLTKFWKRGENLRKYWLYQRSNHANFVSNSVTTELDGESVPYSVTENAGVCSSCVEFFNVLKPESRKLVRACPGSVIFGNAARDVYYDVRPERHDC